jgi:hypothetical protein
VLALRVDRFIQRLSLRHAQARRWGGARIEP